MDQFKNLAPQYKLLIGVGFLGFVAAAFYYLVIMETDSQIAQLRTGYRQAQKELEKYKDFAGEEEIAQLREEYAGVIKKIEENKKIIPDEENLPELMSGLESDALEAGLRVVSKEQKEREYEDFYYRIPIKFEVAGSYIELVRFLKLIAQPDKRLVNVSVFDIKTTDTRKKRGSAVDSSKSPFGSPDKVAAVESQLTATFIIEGFTYTGGAGGRKTKKKGK